MIETRSSFLYLSPVTSDNYTIDFEEGGDPYTASVAVGNYTVTTICTAIEDALNAAGTFTYSVSFTRSTRRFNIEADSAFRIKSNTGPTVGTGIYPLIGFSTASDTGVSVSHTGDSAAGTLYTPQFWLQDYVSTDHFQQAVDATVNKSASGKVEVYRVGTEKFTEFNIKWITDRDTDGSAITYNASGVANAASFMQFAVTKAPFEFMPDKDTVATFQTLILESTPASSNGTGYKLDEQYERGLMGFYETGRLKCRLIE